MAWRGNVFRDGDSELYGDMDGTAIEHPIGNDWRHGCSMRTSTGSDLVNRLVVRASLRPIICGARVEKLSGWCRSNRAGEPTTAAPEHLDAC
jgi:hypothetical protein